MRFLFVAAGTFRANASILRAACLARELNHSGHEAQLLLLDGQDSRELVAAKDLGNMTHWVANRRPPAFLAAAASLPRPDWVHVINANLVGLLSGRSARRRGARVVSDWDEWLSRVPSSRRLRWRRLLLEWLARQVSDAYLFASRHLCEHYGPRVAGRPQLYLPYALDPSPHPDEVRWAERVRLQADQRYIAYVGSLDACYRTDLEELVLLAEACRDFGWGLVVAGDGSERPALAGRLAKILPAERLVMPGRLPVPLMDGLLSQPSIAATFLPLEDTVQNRARCPNKMFHYIKAGRPVVTNRVGEAASLLGDQGHYYRYRDAGSLGSTLRRAAEAQPSYDLESFSWRMRCAAYERFLRDLPWDVREDRR